MQEYVIGIDGGGTKTKAVLVSLDGEIVSEAEAGTSNYQVIGGDRLAALLGDITRRLVEEAAVDRQAVRHLVVGLAGVGRASDREAVAEILKGLRLGRRWTVESDAAAALAGAFGGGEGVILISGTGSICFGKGANGRVERSGGWGHLLGDEGSGYFIGQQAVLAALKDLDGRGPKTVLRQAIKMRYDLERIDRIIPRIYQGDLDRSEIAALAPLVFELAGRGDPVARDIVRRAGYELGLLAAAVIKKLPWSAQKVPVAPLGGVFKQKKALLPHLRRALRKENCSVRFVEPLLDAAAGAAVIGLQREGLQIQADVLKRLMSSSAA